MSIDHKAWLFDYNTFQKALAPILHDALERDDVTSLLDFRNQHLAQLIDLETEESPDEDWEERWQDISAPEVKVQRYADLALTKYHDPTDNLGLSYGFDPLVAYFRIVPHLHKDADLLICGYLFGPKGRRLEPGYMGTGMLSPIEGKRLLALLEKPGWLPIPGPGSEIYAEC